MDASQPSLKKPAMVALAALGVLLIGAIIFFQERLFADTSFIAFNIINNNSLSIQEHRYGSFITQIVPYLGTKFHLSIKAILISYAISFNLFYLFAAYLLVYKLKQYGLAILMAFFYFLFVSDSYFWPVNEINQAIAWMFLFFGVTLYLGNKRLNIFVLLMPFLLLAFLTIFTHFVVIIPTTFLWVYFWMDGRKWPFSKNRSILLSCLLIAVAGIKFSLASEQSYDGEHLHGATHFSLQDIIDAFITPVIKMFFYRCLVNYWWAVIVFILGITSLVKEKQKILAIWVFVSVTGYCIAMGLVYGTLDSNVQLFHIESEWTCISVILSTPFVFSFLPKLKPTMAVWFLIVIFITRLFYIGTSIPAFRGRIQLQEHILLQMKKKGIPKLALYRDNVINQKYMLDWTAGFESLFSSAMNGDKPQLTFCFINKDDKQNTEALANPKQYYRPFYIIDYSDLNKRYFNIDTVHPYQIMTYEELFK